MRFYKIPIFFLIKNMVSNLLNINVPHLILIIFDILEKYLQKLS